MRYVWLHGCLKHAFKFKLGNVVIDRIQYDRKFIIVNRHKTPHNDPPTYTIVSYKYEHLLPSGYQRDEQYLGLATKRLSDEELLTHWHESVRDLYYRYHPRPTPPWKIRSCNVTPAIIK